MSKQQHFVTFFSPGAMFSEVTTKPIKEWNIHIATRMAKSIKERYGATPYAFQFTTRARNDDELDSHEVARSNRYYLGGKILTLDDIKTRNDPNDYILISNMEINNYEKVIENTNSYKICLPFEEGKDFVVEFSNE